MGIIRYIFMVILFAIMLASLVTILSAKHFVKGEQKEFKANKIRAWAYSFFAASIILGFIVSILG